VNQLIGRGHELRALEELLSQAAQGRGGLAMLLGEPGIGKTRLADAAAEAAMAMGFRVAWGRAWESGGAPPYFPWIQALAVLGLPVPDASLVTAVEAEAARFQVFSAVAGELRAASAKAPTLLVLDDLHVADLSSLRMLQFVARELRSLKLAIVGTRRDVDARTTPEMEWMLAKIAREGRTLELPRLERADVARLVRAEGVRIAGDLAAELEPAIWQASQGNPLFVGEIVRLVESSPTDVRRAPLPIPFGVREVIRQRIALLDEATLEVLDVAAVLGVAADEPTVRAAVFVLTETNGADVEGAIAVARRAGILDPGSGGGALSFSHALTRDALYQDIPRTKRIAIHAAVAVALEGRDASTPPVVEIAHHAIEAGADVVQRVARAAEGLSRACADEDAVALVERALAALEATKDERGAAELRLLLGRTRMRLGDLAGGRACALRVAETARSLEDNVLFARAALAYGTELTVGHTDPTMRSFLEETLERLDGAVTPIASARTELLKLRVRARARLAACLQPAPDPAAVARMSLEAVAQARELGDDATLLDVLRSAGATLGEAYFVPEGIQLDHDAVRIATSLGDRAALLRARLRLIFALIEAGDVAGADANIDAFESEARATAQLRQMWPIPLLRSMRAMQEGRWVDCDALVEEASELIERSAEPMAPYALMLHRWALAMEAERSVVAFEPALLAMVSRWNDPETYSHVMIAVVRAFDGDANMAREHLARVSLDSTAGRIRITIGNLIAAAMQSGATERAADFYERVRHEEGNWLIGRFSGFFVRGTYGRYLGWLASTFGRRADAERHFEGALSLASAAGARPERARILAAYGSMLATGGDVERARPMLAEASALAVNLGLSHLAACIRPIGWAARSTPALSPVESVEPAPTDRPPEASAPPTPERVEPLSHPREEVGVRHARATLTLTPEGDTWLLALGDASLRLKDVLGVRYVARLVADPEREIHALDLAGAGDDETRGDAGEALDANARAAYKRRLAELDEELREAESWNDGARVLRARTEMGLLSSELSRAVGLGGRSRRTGSAAERARIAVTRRIRDMIKRVSEQAPELGRYLENTIKTGSYCAYRPM
jgi:tetratricopeptide (TPR) repeat protein